MIERKKERKKMEITNTKIKIKTFSVKVRRKYFSENFSTKKKTSMEKNIELTGSDNFNHR